MAATSLAFVRAVQVAEAKGLLLHELILRLRTIRQEFGEEAPMLELALQAAVLDEGAAWREEQERKMMT